MLHQSYTDSFSKLLPIFTIIVLLCGVNTANTYYSFFGINIFEFISFSDAASLVFNDILYYLVLICVFLVASYLLEYNSSIELEGLVSEKDKKLALLKEEAEYHKLRLLIISVLNSIVLLLKHESETVETKKEASISDKAIPSDGPDLTAEHENGESDQVGSNNEKLAHRSSNLPVWKLIVTILLIMLLFSVHHIMFYFKIQSEGFVTGIAIVCVAIHLLLNKTYLKIPIPLLSVVMLISISLGIGAKKAVQAMNSSSSQEYYVLYPDSKIEVDSSTVYIGRTKSEFFLYDVNTKITRTYSLDDYQVIGAKQ